MSGFLARWSKRASAARQSQEIESANSAPEVAGKSAPVPEKDEPAAKCEPSLPDPETLGAGSDYRPFLQRSVAPALRRLALRRLWRSDPLLANLDGLNDYDDDFAALHRSGAEAIADAIRAGRRYAREPGGSTDDALPSETGASPAVQGEPPQEQEIAASADTDPDPEEGTG